MHEELIKSISKLSQLNENIMSHFSSDGETLEYDCRSVGLWRGRESPVTFWKLSRNFILHINCIIYKHKRKHFVLLWADMLETNINFICEWNFNRFFHLTTKKLWMLNKINIFLKTSLLPKKSRSKCKMKTAAAASISSSVHPEIQERDGGGEVVCLWILCQYLFTQVALCVLYALSFFSSSQHLLLLQFYCLSRHFSCS